MKQYGTYIVWALSFIFLKLEAATASNGLTTWDNIFGKPNDLVRMVDTSLRIGTKSDINVPMKAVRDSAAAISGRLKTVAYTNAYSDLNGLPSLFSGNYADLSGKPNINSYTNGSGLGIFGSGNNFTFYIDSNRIMTTSSATTTINNMNNDINGKVPNSRTITINGVTQDLSANRTWTVGGAADYYNSATTTSGTATFYLTDNKLSTGTALYSQINYVNPLVNNVNGNYTFGWTVSPDLKTLTVQSRVATNTAVIALIGISVLGSTVQVPNGTTIQVLVKGQ